ncbi:hypothetical protein [Chryseobacterium indoltheticum]|uniref:Bacteriocin n=1 Tax=Chryseobacterium indoltheticum TaxID=254 RepID=A0A381F3W2_9FLAO|nr:hypothetical protein [Chryseobacterium indoltheticum]AZA74849.1 hypothetical protein EG358_14215 [Chryseobacterium indoltheticum]SIQ33168.1 hypothetical protein SAMN05421682_104120 [Chryseobacterium indoltheticum]SUX41289.1 Uncharacterised protein [Chryseobacterium indoltheticum]
MTNNILKNSKKLKKSDLKDIVGGIGKVGTPDLSLCGCSCTGAVTGPLYCTQYMGCPQVYNCKD